MKLSTGLVRTTLSGAALPCAACLGLAASAVAQDTPYPNGVLIGDEFGQEEAGALDDSRRGAGATIVQEGPQSQDAPVVTGGDEVPVVSVPLVTWEPRYHDQEGIEEFLARCEEVASDTLFVRRADLGTSFGGRALSLLEWGRPAAGSAQDPDEFFAEAPTVVLVGGLDGTSLVGAEAVLASVAELLSDPAALPEGVAFAALPWAAPDGLVQNLVGQSNSGRNARPVDEDFDGQLDEDGPDDLDGDGLILDMLIEDPAGPWARAADWRFLVPAKVGDAPRYTLHPEGRDDDGDDRFNEDPAGGVLLDRNFPVGWDPALAAGAAGQLPLSEPAARALVDFLLSRRVVTVLLFQGNHGGLVAPGGTEPGWPAARLPAERHAAAFARFAEDWSAATGRPLVPVRPLRELTGRTTPGVALDWIYTGAGALALEVAPWGPELHDTNEALAEPLEPGGEAESRLAPADQAWGRWLDNTRGGLGFVDWHPVDLGNGRVGLVGGWEPRTRANPPEEELEAAVQGMGAFARAVARRVPRLELEVTEVVRDGDVVRLAVRLRNRGSLPSGLTLTGAATCRIDLELPPGATLVAGPQEARLNSLSGGGVASTVEWVLVLPQGKSLRITAEDHLAAPVERELAP